jgi:hypothetical protein
MLTGKYKLRTNIFGRIIIYVEDQHLNEDPGDISLGKTWRKARKYERKQVIEAINSKFSTQEYKDKEFFEYMKFISNQITSALNEKSKG